MISAILLDRIVKAFLMQSNNGPNAAMAPLKLYCDSNRSPSSIPQEKDPAKRWSKPLEAAGLTPVSGQVQLLENTGRSQLKCSGSM